LVDTLFYSFLVNITLIRSVEQCIDLIKSP